MFNLQITLIMKQKLLRIALTLFTLSYSILNGFAFNMDRIMKAIEKNKKEGNITHEFTIMDIVIMVLILVLLAGVLWKMVLRNYYEEYKNCKTKKDYLKLVLGILVFVLAICLGALHNCQ